MEYKQLGKEERSLIWHYHRLGHSKRAIGRFVAYSHSTILRELSRNHSEADTWQAASTTAQELSVLRKSKANSHPKITEEMTELFVQELLEKRTTPELFAGARKLSGKNSVGKDAYYRWLYQERRDLIKYLPRQGRKLFSKRRKARKLPAPPIPKVNISKRPVEAAQRTFLGHLEGDTMHGKKGNSVLSVHIDMASRKVFLTKISSTTALEFKDATLKILKHIPENQRLSLTLDNGPEMALFHKINKHIQTYFCNAYHSWEKGSVENRIQVLRLFIPKGLDIDLLTDLQIQRIEDLVNDRPMKILNFKTPNQVFNDLLNNKLAA